MSSNPRRILFVGTVFPEPVSSAAGVRTESLLEDFLSRGDRVLFVSPSDHNRFSEALRARGIETAQVGPNDPAFDALVREFRPDIAVFDRFMLEEQFGWRVSEHAPSAIRVLDTIDLHFLRRWRGDRLKQAILSSRGESFVEGARVAPADLELLFVSDIRGLPGGEEGIETGDCLREIAAIHRSDLSLILSSFERELLHDRFQVPVSLLLELGFSYPPPDLAARRPFESRRHLVSIGTFRHPPNRDSAFWMARELWPGIRRELERAGDRETELHLYGAYPPKEVMALDDRSARFRVFGPAESAIATLRRYRALLAPLRFGAGIKGKIADAWSAGIPVVTTPIGAEGMRVLGSFAGVIASNEAELERAAAAIVSDPEAQARRIAEGDHALASLYSPEANRRALFERLDALSEPGALARARERNFVGRLLRSDLHARTKYFSKWIEAKNASSASVARNANGGPK
jgi:glycosyltransferase involved in cell wall biosynthesis